MTLTPRQREVAALVAKGYSNKRIARTVGISPRTVECHIQTAAARLTIPGPPRHRLVVFVLQLDEAA
jgi:DNA-binding NarL/FixJ family response regulator